MSIENYYGRLLTEDQLVEEVRDQALILPSMYKKKRDYYCNRCKSKIDLKNWKLDDQIYYCRACIQLGRIRSDQNLYHIPQKDFKKQHVLKWKGELTNYQQIVSDGLIHAMRKNENTLVHAVTGAGKTEMMYQVVDKEISQGKSVCIATPRIDVCLELYRRMKEDFSCPISLLHGKSEAYFRTPLVIATTHQLLKFYQAFDLLIIDEVDAFPYVDNPMLYAAVENAKKNEGMILYLTATSTDELDKKVRNKELVRYSLPRRFHGNPLVIPKKVWIPKIREKIQKKKLPSKMFQLLKIQIKTNYPLLLFVSEISLGQELLEIVKKYFPNEQIGFVSSKTEDRLKKVEKFRNGEIRILISTTILERGVTFPNVDVFVVESDHRLFTRSALVQISGRVGRSKERPTGELLFLSEGTTRAINQAIAEIKQMNKEAGF